MFVFRVARHYLCLIMPDIFDAIALLMPAMLRLMMFADLAVAMPLPTTLLSLWVLFPRLFTIHLLIIFLIFELRRA